MTAAWTTKVAPNWSMTLGLTYDYYAVRNATATTYLDGQYYEDAYAAIEANDPDDPRLDMIYDSWEACGGDKWTCVDAKEVNSFYRSIGARVGVVGKF